MNFGLLGDFGLWEGVLRDLRELLEPSCDPLWASWRHDGLLEDFGLLEGPLGRSWDLVGPSSGPCEAFWAVLEPSCRPLGPSWAAGKMTTESFPYFTSPSFLS